MPRYQPSRLVKSVLIFAILNFLAFAATAQYLGGDAINGKIENGHYYLLAHGLYTEVSAQVFTYSRRHGYAVRVMWVLALALALSDFMRQRPPRA